MCNCKSELEEKLTTRFKDATPDARAHKVTLQGYGFAIKDKTMYLQPYMTYQGFSYVPLKKGGEKPKKVTGNMFFSYCPFCGVKVQE